MLSNKTFDKLEPGSKMTVSPLLEGITHEPVEMVVEERVDADQIKVRLVFFGIKIARCSISRVSGQFQWRFA